MVVDSYYRIDAGWMYLKVTLAKEIKKPDYNVILVNTGVDMKKMMNGVQFSELLTMISARMLTSS